MANHIKYGITMLPSHVWPSLSSTTFEQATFLQLSAVVVKNSRVSAKLCQMFFLECNY